MKRFYGFLMMCLLFTFTIDAQQHGDFLVGANSSLSSLSLDNISLEPSIMYGITDDVFGGISLSGDEEDLNLGVTGRVYVTDFHPGLVYVQGTFETDTEADSNSFSVSTGFTSFISTWFFVEPNFSYTFSDNDQFGIGINFGLRL